MGRKVEFSNRYLKYLEKAKKQKNFKQSTYEEILRLIANKQKIPPQYRDHALSKVSPDKYQGCRDVHISPNMVLVYRITDDSLQLICIGSHQDLGLTENMQ